MCTRPNRCEQPQAGKRPLSVDGICDQPKFLNDCFDWLWTICVKTESGKDVTNTVKCFAGWQLSIASLGKLTSGPLLSLGRKAGFVTIHANRFLTVVLQAAIDAVSQRQQWCRHSWRHSRRQPTRNHTALLLRLQTNRLLLSQGHVHFPPTWHEPALKRMASITFVDICCENCLNYTNVSSVSPVAWNRARTWLNDNISQTEVFQRKSPIDF